MRHLAHEGTACSSELAYTLGVSPALVESLLEHLVRRGYLRLLVPGPAAPCERCPLRAACLYRWQPRVWALSAKGQSLLDRRLEA